MSNIFAYQDLTPKPKTHDQRHHPPDDGGRVLERQISSRFRK